MSRDSGQARSGRIIQVFLVSMVAVLAISAVYTSVFIRERQESLRNIFRYNVAHTTSQAVMEFQRLQQALLQLERERTAESVEEAKLRYEILYNRAEVFDAGDIANFIHADPGRIDVLQRFREAVRAVEPIMATAGPGLDVHRPMLILEPLEKELIGIASEANRYGAELIAADQRELARLHQRLSGLIIGLIVCGISLVGMLTWNNRLLVSAHRSLSSTTDDLKRTASDLASANQAVAFANQELRARNRRLVEKEDALRSQNMLFDAALNNMSQGLCMFDDALRPIVFNTQFQRLFRFSAAVARDDPMAAMTSPSLRQLAPDLAPELQENVSRNEAASFETECADGRIVAVSQQPMPDGGWVATFEDVTEQRRVQARIAYMARHDGLTSLPNRNAFRERIHQAVHDCGADGTMLAVMCLDLDHFKAVNDTLGHPAGDALLCAVAERLSACVRDTDMVARFGGDEFAILQPGMQRVDEAERLAARVVEDMRKPFQINGEAVYATASLGIAVAPRHGHDPDALLKNADLALYAAKADGRRSYRFFETEMDERLSRRHAMERDLRQALAEGQFDLHYQPVVHLRSMKITGLEALLRWTHPVRGMVPPSTFIPVAEDAGLITEIGRWVLRRACQDAASWPAHLKVSVNLSAAQFAHGDIAEDIADTLQRTPLRPDRLVVEITESLLLSENKATLGTLHRLKALGIDIAMDDFGTGYSSLSYLRKYPFDRIKIDRAFVSTASHGEQGAAIIKTIVNLGHSLGMGTVAEGVETEKDLEMLLAAGCAEGQGYLFSPPVPRDRVFDLVAAHEQRIGKVA